MWIHTSLHVIAPCIQPESVITAITKGISLPYAGNLEPIDAQIMHLIDLVLEAGQQGQQQGQAAEGTIDHKAEADNPTEEVQAVTEVAVTAEAPHKTTTTADHQDVVDAAQHPTDTRSATSLHP